MALKRSIPLKFGEDVFKLFALHFDLFTPLVLERVVSAVILGRELS